MPSIRSKLFIGLLRISSQIRFKMKGKDPDTSAAGVLELRRKTEKSGALMGKLPKDITISALDINGVYAEWVSPSKPDVNGVILYFHGGGYVIGSAQGHRFVVAKFVKGSGIKALCFSYGLAPENPFPIALNNSVDCYKYLLDQGFPSDQIVFMGDSAGGGLCLATLLALKEENIPLPAAAVALSPWTDLKNTADSIKTNIKVDHLTWRDSWVNFAKHYAGENDPGNPLISPLYGDLVGLPPLLIFAGDDELLRDDSVRFAKKAADAGVNVTLHVEKGMFHCYPACAPLFPEATIAKDAICKFVSKHLQDHKQVVEQ